LGDKVTVSLYQTAMFAFNLVISAAQYGFSYPVSRKAVANPFLNTYRTKDDRWLQIACPEYDRLFPVIMKAIDREDLTADARYSTTKSISGKTTEIIEIIEKQIEAKTADEWMAIFEKCDVPCEKALLWGEIAKDEQAWANEYLHEMHYENGNVRTLVDTPVKFGSIGKVEHTRGPLIGEHNVEILKTLGYSDAQIQQLVAEKVIVGA
jgi:crotonobetainyl-CoA:carnitine CoA-transferase CaiB-like acyl-CoA transferase